MTTAQILTQFPNLRVFVVGDVCLDRWCRYDPALADPSRETGIPRIGVIATEISPGAAGTVAANVAALKAQVGVLGLVGADGFGFELGAALQHAGITSHLLQAPNVPTFTYTKLINACTGEEDLPRVDFVYTEPVPDEFDRELVRRLEESANQYDVILVSDQAETEHGGIVTPRMREALARIAEAHPETVIWVDSRMRAEHFRRVIVKINRFEAEKASTRALGCIDYRALRRHSEAPLMMITRGGKGVQVVHGDIPVLVPTRNVPNPVDICGAGDSFSAGAALALRITRDPVAAARFGNLVASITIMKKGTGTASPEEVLEASGHAD
jgi:rfaE bifunctional protein kinase chain/domain